MKEILIISTLNIGLSSASFGEEVKTVDWYEKHEVERKAMIKKCQNNPGELRETPNCINAVRAKDNIFFNAPLRDDW